MASAADVAIVQTPKGIRVSLGKLYMYPDGHANLTFPAIPEKGVGEINLPLTNPIDVVVEFADLVRRMQNEIVKQRPAV